MIIAELQFERSVRVMEELTRQRCLDSLLALDRPIVELRNAPKI